MIDRSQAIRGCYEISRVGLASNELSQLVKHLGEQGTIVLMATHDLYRAKEVASHVLNRKKLVDRLGGVRPVVRLKGTFNAINRTTTIGG